MAVNEGCALGGYILTDPNYYIPVSSGWDGVLDIASIAGGAFVSALTLAAGCNPAADLVTLGISCGAAASGVAAGWIAGPGGADDPLLGGDGDDSSSVGGGSPFTDTPSATLSGESYTTPSTTSLGKLVNPLGGNRNCAAVCVATDRTLSGTPTSAVGGGEYPAAYIESYAGASLKQRSLTSIVKSISSGGDGARGIIVGYRVNSAHAFNVINNSGVVQFIDGQSGIADPVDQFVMYEFVRTN
jgi:hypothetical protein